MKVLIVEDDAETADYIVNGLTEHGHVVDHARNGREGLVLAGAGAYEVAVVDRMLPGLDGLSLVKALRGDGVKTAVLFLTNLGGIDDRVEGLDAGGDDYLVKPFAFSELLARVNALGRRPVTPTVDTVLRVADLDMDLLKRGVTRTMLLELVWDFHFDPKTNIVETHMSRLRAKVDRGFDCELIHTIRGSGYSLRAPA
jgi:two-component system OmpR family response regulator